MKYIYREYLLDKLTNSYFDYFIDIGGGRGDFSTTLLEISPHTKIFIYEPFLEGYLFICDLFKSSLNIFVFNEALGNGSTLYLKSMPRWDQNIFEEKDLSGDNVSVLSRTLKSIIDSNKIDLTKRCGIKVDCEGGEWFLVRDVENIDLLKQFSYAAIEVHFKPTGLKNPQFKNFPVWQEFNSWIENNFKKYFHVQYVNSSKHRGHGIYILNRI